MEIHLQNAPDQSPEVLAPRQVAPSDSILEESEEDDEHKPQNSPSPQNDVFKIPAVPVSIIQHKFYCLFHYLCTASFEDFKFAIR